MANADDGANILRTAREQLCIRYRSIEDFRAQPLGFLPLMTGGGLVLLAGQAGDVEEGLLPIRGRRRLRWAASDRPGGGRPAGLPAYAMSFSCSLASVGHPNEAGANTYFEAIKATL